MKIELTPAVVDAVNYLQENPGIIHSIVEAEDVMLEYVDENYAGEVIQVVKSLRYLKRFLDKIASGEGGEA